MIHLRINTHQMNKKTLITLFAASMLSTLIAQAQEGMKVTLDINGSASNAAEIKNSSGNEMEIRKGSVNATFVSPVGEKSVLIASIGSSRTDYDFKRPEGLWNDVNSHDASLFVETRLDDRWNLLGLALLSSSYEDDLKFGDGLVWGGGVAARYKSSDTLSYVFGVAYIKGFLGRELVIPLVGVEWMITERLKLDGIMGLELSYDLLGDQSGWLSVGLDYVIEDFQIANDPISGAERSIRPDGFGLYVSYTQYITDNLALSASLSTVGEQEFETRSGGDKVSSFKAESSLLAGLGVQYTF
jgi:hypothetical protein